MTNTKNSVTVTPVEKFFINSREVCAMLGVSITTLWRLRHENADFPKAVMLTAKKPVWKLAEVKRWCEGLPSIENVQES